MNIIPNYNHKINTTNVFSKSQNYQLENKNYDEVNLPSISNKKTSLLTFKGMTKGHFQNIPFETNLNDYLRYPKQSVNFDIFSNMSTNITSNNFTSANYYSKENITPEKADILTKELNQEFEQLPMTKKEKLFYRGLYNVSQKQFEQWKNLKVGENIIPDKGFAYVTPSEDMALKYCKGTRYHQKNFNNSVLLSYILPKGSKISESGRIGLGILKGGLKLKFNEAMLPAGIHCEVINKTLTNDGLLKLSLKVINDITK